MKTQPLGSLIKPRKGKRPEVLYDAPRDGFVPYLDLFAVEHGTTRKWVDPADGKLVPDGSVVMVWDGARSGWAGLTPFDGALGSTLSLLESDLHPRFLAAFLRAHFAGINFNHRGSGIPHVNPDYLYALEVPVVDKDAQLVLARLLEQVAARAKSATVHLGTARTALDNFRRQIYRLAASGGLTERWREASGLTEGWQDVKLSTVAECLDSRRRPVNAAERARRPGNVPYYGANGQVGTIDEPLFDEALVLVVEDETFLGRVKPFSYLIDGPSWVNNHAHVLRPGPSVMPEFLNIALSYYDFVPLTSGTTGRRKLNQRALLGIEIGLPPYAEQNEIVSCVSRLNTSVRRVDKRLTRASERLNLGSRVVLARAFRDELVGLNGGEQ